MKIAFLALSGTFGYSQVGGTDSFMRRLIEGISSCHKRLQASWIFYNSDNHKALRHSPRFISTYFPTLGEALQYIADSSYSHVISTYLAPKDRLRFALFRKGNSSIRFHSMVFFYPESIIQRFIKFSEYLCFPYNGKVFCVSKRQYNCLRKLTNNVIYLPPSVPEDYFLMPRQKPNNGKVNVTFLGRVDPRKGIRDVINLFEALSENSKIECAIYGIHIPEDRECLEVHRWLKMQTHIRYVEIDRQGYSLQIEEMVKGILKKTDVFIQPYRNLDSSVDTPLLLLEAMASLCAVITTPVGDVPDIYGHSKFAVNKKHFSADALDLLQNLTLDQLQREKMRVYEQIKKLNVGVDAVAKRFLDALR